ncbi:uncharacterized protein LOC131675879 [Topomyia yanbarensis]|uniref:uncharacterized protein LOC131675879 n=1 Tax=Topomyia yanbarensis TaxID=2498891 RepID=UPI00273B2F78|nr:uncharacterized protein LOC131675879 [Topomyia yanbarensis]
MFLLLGEFRTRFHTTLFSQVFVRKTSSPNRWKTFVANRVSTIQTSTEGSIWQHVPGAENPADELSRGLQPAELLARSRRWNGPVWLAVAPSHRPHSVVPDDEASAVIEEARKVALVSLATSTATFAEHLFNPILLVHKAASCGSVLSEVHPFAESHDQQSTGEPSSVLTTAELTAADHALARLAQAQLYSEKLSGLNVPSSHNQILK